MIWYSERRENSEIQILEDRNTNKPNLNISFRFLSPDDIDEVRLLCEDSFPIEYPLSWYEDITTNSTRFFSLAAVYNFAIVGLMVAEIKSWAKCNKEDRTILSESYGKNHSLAYILSLGVHRKYRRNGIATLLLQTFMDHLQSTEQNVNKIKAIYLHVLTTNQPAIIFYERYNFVLHAFLPYYYSIRGSAKDGFCYVRYINGGKPPQHFFEEIRDLCSKLISVAIFGKLSNAIIWIAGRFRLLVSWFNYNAFSKIHFRQ